MSASKDLEHYITALRWTESVSVAEVLHNAHQSIQKLEQDKKVLRWALERARDALLGHEHQTDATRSALATLESAQMITEPANDR